VNKMPRRVIKVKDKWKEKTWVQVEAPAIFGNKIIVKVPITEVKNAVGRIIETSLFDLVGEEDSGRCSQNQLQTI
jgi:small subunit ribosomal protein S3Ae